MQNWMEMEISAFLFCIMRDASNLDSSVALLLVTAKF